MRRISALLAIAAFFVLCAGNAYAASAGLDVDSIVFNADERQDIMGPMDAQEGDGRWDASFSLSVSGAQAIKKMSLRNEENGNSWSTNPSGNTGLLLVKDTNGKVLNGSGRLPVIPVLFGADFKLYINDAPSAIRKDSKFVVKVELIDGKEVYGETFVKAIRQPGTQKTPSEEGITSFEALGYSDNDFAGLSEKLAADGKNDFQFAISFQFSDTTVSGIRITAWTRSNKTEWDTIEKNNVPIIIAVDRSDRIANKTDGTVSLRMRGPSSYSLLVQDSGGILSDPDVRAKVSVILSDGRIFERDAVLKWNSGISQHAKDTLTAKYIGRDRYDFVGSSEKLESDLTPDRRIDTAINTSGTVTGIRVKDTRTGRIWDTVAKNRNSLAALTDENGKIINDRDGTLSFQVNGRRDLLLWINEENDASSGPYDITFVLSDGRILEASTAVTGNVIDKKKPERMVRFVSARPAVVNVDMVGKNKKRAANGAKDTSVNIRITGSGTISAMAVVNTAGKGWDTTAGNNGRWLLGIREGTKIMNTPNGKLGLRVNGAKTYQLLMQDNGILAKKNGRLMLYVTWSDGEVTESLLKW